MSKDLMLKQMFEEVGVGLSRLKIWYSGTT